MFLSGSLSEPLQVRAQTVTIPAGDRGTAATVSIMQRIVRHAYATPLVRDIAVGIVRYIPVRNDVAQIKAIREWCAERLKFLRDPFGTELLHTPEVMLRQISAYGMANVDCDDAAILAAALGRSIGLRARFVMVAFHRPSAPYTHVWAELAPQRSNTWYEMDVTRGAQYIPIQAIVRRKTIEA